MSETAISYGEMIWDPETYDAQRRRLVPFFDLLYGAVGDLVAELGGAQPVVLDLGAGTGLLSAAVIGVVPGVRLHLMDGSGPMIDRAMSRLRAHVVGVTVADLTDPLPVGPFAAVVSALAIHHLDDEAKRNLFRRVRSVLVPGGLFVNLEQIVGPDEETTERYERMHERWARGAGSDDEEWAGALARMAHDRCAPLDDQLGWLRQAGFGSVDCAVKAWRFAVYSGRAR
ncbi:class I SAM-dependent methyltransferase [Frankia sp. Mgl5]|uniref:class I SAM-dependent methyltransferase n=1 Tax=Frankia sp. Mgl5 TaxID=2933793 RepID=UPI00200C7367|nr:class I SAM-dependent methyltransferase [Frankia sp. Mgl5]MCK9930903.1 class I SAM-dependent methyltransferase [Frankia sp. Mgl5]